MAQLSIAQYTKNVNIRKSLAYNKSTGLYWYNWEWITKEKLDEFLPITPIPEINNRNKKLLTK